MMRIDQRQFPEETGKNFRYQMLLLRILGDYQTKLRYAHDQQLEREAYEALQTGETADVRVENALNMSAENLAGAGRCEGTFSDAATGG